MMGIEEDALPFAFQFSLDLTKNSSSKNSVGHVETTKIEITQNGGPDESFKCAVDSCIQSAAFVDTIERN